MEDKVVKQLDWVVQTLRPADASDERQKEIASALNTLQIMLRNAEQLHLPDHTHFETLLPIAWPLSYLADHPVDARGAVQAYLDFFPIHYILEEGTHAMLTALQWTTPTDKTTTHRRAGDTVDRSVEESVVTLILDLYERRASKTKADFHALTAATPLWQEIKQKLAHTSEVIGQKAIRTLFHLYKADIDKLDEDAEDIKRLMRTSEATTYRVYDLLAQLGDVVPIKSDVLGSFFETLKNDLDGNDPLLVLNAIESVHNFMKSPRHVHLLSSAGVIDVLKERAKKEEDATIQQYLSYIIASIPAIKAARATSSSTSSYQ